MSKTLNITAKCSDLFAATLYDNGKNVGDYDGYVPAWLGDDDSGDYVELSIDLETGQIKGWRKPTAKQLAETFGVTKK